MRVNHVTHDDMSKVLRVINKKYNNNVIWNRYEQKGNQIHFTLRVRDSKKAGHRVSYAGRRIPSACWHVHGDFFDALFNIAPDAVVYSRGITVTKGYSNWMDWNCGSKLIPFFMSEACGCDMTDEEEAEFRAERKRTVENPFNYITGV